MRINSYPARKDHEHTNIRFEIHALISLPEEMQQGEFLPIFHDAYTVIWIQEGSGDNEYRYGKICYR